MLDENLPTFYIKPSSDNALTSTIYLSQNGSELTPEYSLRRPDPALPASKNCYAVALYDPYNPDVLFAEVLVRPEWMQPTLSAAEIRAQNGVPPPPIPIVPGSFTVQLYNPDQQVVVRQVAGSWNSSAYWEFEMPQNSFRVPSASSLDRSQDDPAVSDITPKVSFKWKRDGKLSRDISCYLAGRTTDTKKHKEPDIPVAMFKSGKNLTMYEPNMNRVEVEDVKGLEVVLLLSATVTKDIFFNANREMFNIGNPTVVASPSGVNPRRKNSGPVIGNGGTPTAPTPVTMSGAVFTSTPSKTQPIPPSQILPPQPARTHHKPTAPPSIVDPRIQWEIDAETERLKRIVQAEEKAREKTDREEAKRIQKMIDKEDKDRRRREIEVEKETERLRKQYGVQPTPAVQVSPPLPSRPVVANQTQPQSFPLFSSAPHSRPVPATRPMSTPQGASQSPSYHYSSASGGQSGNPYLMSPSNYYQPPPQQPAPSHNQGHKPRPSGGGSGNSPYLQPGSGSGAASSSGFFGLGGKKVQKKRSVFF